MAYVLEYKNLLEKACIDLNEEPLDIYKDLTFNLFTNTLDSVLKELLQQGKKYGYASAAQCLVLVSTRKPKPSCWYQPKPVGHNVLRRS